MNRTIDTPQMAGFTVSDDTWIFNESIFKIKAKLKETNPDQQNKASNREKLKNFSE